MSDVQPTGAETVTWDLSDLYAAIDDPAIDRDLNLSDAEADALGEKYRGRVASLSAAELAEMLARVRDAARTRLQSRQLRPSLLVGRHERAGLRRTASEGH